MKKAVLMAMAIFFGFVSVSVAENYPARKVFFGTGEIQKSIPFPFEVPAGNCEDLKTYQFVPGNWQTKGKWETLEPGTVAPQGVYRFVSEDKLGCSVRVDIEGEVPWSRLYESFTMSEIEPSDVGLLVKDHWKPGNPFKLPTNDLVASFYLLQPNIGMSLNIGIINQHPNDFIFYQGFLYGVIVCDNQGFLKKHLSGDALIEKGYELWIADDDVVILEFREEYR